MEHWARVGEKLKAEEHLAEDAKKVSCALCIALCPASKETLYVAPETTVLG